MCLNFKRTNIVFMIMCGVIKTCGKNRPALVNPKLIHQVNYQVIAVYNLQGRRLCLYACLGLSRFSYAMR